MLYKVLLCALCYCTAIEGHSGDDIDTAKDSVLVGVKFYATRPTRGLSELDAWNRRYKRGIVFLDEEFDVPAKSGVKHGWSGIESKSYNVFESTIEKDDGSGGDLLPGFESTPLDYISSPRAEQMQLTMKDTQPTKDTQLDEVKFTIKTTQIRKVQLTSEDPQHDTLPTTPEGSGDDETTAIKSTEETKTSSNVYRDGLSESCLNRTCSVEDLTIHAAELIPEGSNITFHCTSNSPSNEALFWYRFNGSNYNLETFQQRLELSLTLHIARREDSGRYVCVRQSEDRECCHREVYVTVYEVPRYKYHLLTIGIVTGMCLMACILLAAFRTRSMNKYTEHFVKVKDSEKPLLI